MFKIFSSIVGVGKNQIVQCASCNGNIIKDAMKCIHCGSSVQQYQGQANESTTHDSASISPQAEA